jgi:endonuclease/exonuclease/phosphatase family metal-dependent hydrolase
MSTIDYLWFWQANLGRGVPILEFQQNFDKIYTRARFAAILLQEVDEADKPDETGYILDQTHRTHRAVGLRTGTAILIPKTVDVVNVDTRLACKGLAKYTPNRYVTEATIRLKHGTEVDLYNTHLPILRVATLTRRRQVRQALREETAHSRNGLWVADTNTHVGWPKIVKGEKTAIDAGIDKAKVWAKGDGRVHVSHKRTVNLTIDNHDAHGALLTWLNAA